MKQKLLMLAMLFVAFAMGATAQTDNATVVLDENFDSFTEGSEDEPATTDLGGFSGKLYNDLKWSYSSSKVYAAGGKLKNAVQNLDDRFKGHVYAGNAHGNILNGVGQREREGGVEAGADIGVLGDKGNDHDHAQSEAEKLVDKIQNFPGRAVNPAYQKVQAHKAALMV